MQQILNSVLNESKIHLFSKWESVGKMREIAIKDSGIGPENIQIFSRYSETHAKRLSLFSEHCGGIQMELP